MRGNLDSIATLPSYRRKLAPHPACGHLPLEGEDSPQKASPFGRSCRPQAADEGRLDSIALLPSCCRKLTPHPACGHLPPQGEGSPQKASPFGRSCRPQAADEGGVRAVSLLTGSIRRLPPHPASGGALATFPRRGKALPKRLPPSGEAAARRRLMRGSFNSIVPLPSYRRKLAPHPACGHLPPEGEGSVIFYLLSHAEGFKHFINRCLCRALASQVAQRLQGVRQADGGGVQPKAVLPCADGFGQRIPRAGRG